MPALIWFRRDLRIHDNTALFNAARSGDGVVGLFLITPGQWKAHDECPAKIEFWLRNLRELSESLAGRNIPLLIRTCDDYAGVPQVVLDVCQQHQCGSIFFNREYEVNEQVRDRAVAEAAGQHGISINRFHDRVLVPPREIKTKEGKFYSVFTPYRKVWDRQVDQFGQVLPEPKKQPPNTLKPDPVPDQLAGFNLESSWLDRYPPGEQEGARRLTQFRGRIDKYHVQRDLPDVEGTSQLSPYLAAGVVSPRQCLQVARQVQQDDPDDHEGTTVWVSELAWRDFYTHVLVGFPRVSKHRPFKEKTEAIPWRKHPQDFEAWCQGRTGYPIVDAGMRQLNQTGWMHNRLRMVTAMFLTKHLLVDWRLGEQYFMSRLIDGDLAANNGGWQWSASTGTDAVPYFRIFNPFSQSKRFDSRGQFIKRMCPELDPIPAAAIHDPTKLATAIETYQVDYPSMVVDYKLGRQRALDAFKALS